MARKNVLIAPDMTDVDDEGGAPRIPAGDYLMECVDVRADRGRESGGEMFVWKFRGLAEEAKGKTFYLYTSLGERAQWKLKQTAKALGIYEDGQFEIDPDAVRGTHVMGVVLDNSYTDNQGRTRSNSKLDTVRATEGGEEEEDPKPAPKTARKGNGKKTNALPQLDAGEVRKMTSDELEDLVEQYKLNINLAKSPTLKSKIAATIQGLDNAGMLSE